MKHNTSFIARYNGMNRDNRSFEYENAVQKSDEILPEQKIETMKAAQERRAELMKNIITERFNSLQKALNFTPFIGDIIMTGKAIVGKESGRDLTSGERSLLFAIGGMGLLAKTLLAQGDHAHGVALQGFAMTLQSIDTLPSVLETAAKFIEPKNTQTAQLMRSVASYITKQKFELDSLVRSFGSHPITLHL